MTEQTGYLLLGALIAITVVLLIGSVLGLALGLRFFDYFGRFKGLQLSRNGKGDMSFGGIIDESKPAPRMPAAAIEQPELVDDTPTLQ